MQPKLERCPKCGNHHGGNCSHEISYFTYYPPSLTNTPETVELVGEWYRWQNHEKMDKHKDNEQKTYFSIGSNVPTGRFEYKFIVDGIWTYDNGKDALKCPDGYGSYNNFIQVLPKKALMEYSPKKDIKFRSSLTLKNLCIIGSWDNWQKQIEMELVYNNLKGCLQNSVYMQLIPNTNYQFKFKIKGKDQYFVDEKYPTIQTQSGPINNRIFVCSQSMNTPTGWRLSNNAITTTYNCRSFRWHKVQVQYSFSEYRSTLDGHSMCQVGQYIYIFGGRIQNDFTNKLTKINIHKLSVMQSQQLMPNQRAFHGAAAYGNKMIVFGGHNKVILQDYIIYNTTDRSWWLTQEIKGKFPSKREKQSCVLYQTLLVFFGGYYCFPDFEFEYTYNDIQVLDIEDMKWIDEDLLKVEGTLPSPRFSHTAAVVQSFMYLFGGKNVYNEKGMSKRVFFNDIWVMNLKKSQILQWQQIKPKGVAPAARHGHTMTVLNQYLVVFGGEGDKKQKFNDVIVFDTQAKQWIYPMIKCDSGSKPLPRVYHGATAINNQSIVIFGGKNVNQKSTSFYVLKPEDIKVDLDIEEQDESQDQEEKNKEKKEQTNQSLKIQDKQQKYVKNTKI